MPPLPPRWSSIIRFLHLAVIVAMAGAFAMLALKGFFPRGERLVVWIWHFGFGASVLMLALPRLVLRLSSPPPHAWTGGFVGVMAKGMTFVLYVLMLMVPISGLLASPEKMSSPVLFGFLPLPLETGTVSDMAAEFHEGAAWTLGILVAGHVFMAVAHGIKDRVFWRRMF